MQRHTPDGVRLWVRSGYPGAVPLGAGMEAAAYLLEPDLVGKIWARRTVDELRRLQACYADLAQADLSFRTPDLLDVRTVGDAVLSVESRLPGRSLGEALPDGAAGAVVPGRAADALLTVLRELRRVPVTDAVKALRVLDEPQPPWSGAQRWNAALSALLEWRLLRHGDSLRRRVSSFDAKMAGLLRRTTTVWITQPAVVHGDLIPDNILVDEELRVSAVLDFGFLTTVGDPAFDAAVTARIFDMYGPAAAATTAALRSRMEVEFGHDRERLLTYEAAYAVLTSNVYDSAGGDDQFAWCAALLDEPEIEDLLLS